MENYDFLINEVSEFAPQKLKDIEVSFENLKKDSKNKLHRISLIQNIKDFSKIKNVILILDNEMNAGIIPVYKPETAISFVSVFKNTFPFGKYDKPITPKELKNLKTVKEPVDAIDRIYLFIGRPLLRILSPQELVAVLLHELGHVYIVTSSIPYQVLRLIKNFAQYFVAVKSFLYVTNIITEFYLIFTLLSFGMIYGITFTRRLGETEADKYVLKYGYGDEFITTMNKFNAPRKVKKSFIGKVNDYIKTFGDYLKFIFDPFEHPSNTKRIDDIENKIFNDYRKIYPQYKSIFDMVQHDYKKNKEVIAN